MDFMKAEGCQVGRVEKDRNLRRLGRRGLESERKAHLLADGRGRRGDFDRCVDVCGHCRRWNGWGVWLVRWKMIAGVSNSAKGWTSSR
jgi:hypothetical protein